MTLIDPVNGNQLPSHEPGRGRLVPGSNNAILEPPKSDESVIASEAADSILYEFDSSCRRFLEWERSVIVLGCPTDAQKERHRLKLRWLIQFARQFLALVQDPACPNEAVAKALNWLLWRLDQSWQTIYNPVPEAEFQRIVSEIFPDDEPGAAGAH